MLILGIYFGVSESTANNIFHYWIDILQELLPSSLLEQFQKKEDEYLWIQEILTEQELIVDNTEKSIYSNVRWHIYIIQITTNVIVVKVLVIVAEFCTTFKDNSNM